MADWVLDKLLRRFLPITGIHLSDERLAALFCRELSLVQKWTARRHLAGCLECRTRQRWLEGPRAERMLQLYHDSLASADMALQERPRTEFVLWLELQMRHEALRQKRIVSAHVGSSRRLSFAFPSASIGAVLGLVLGVSGILLLRWERMPNITANTLLVRAEQWGMPSLAANPGVARQTIQIKTGKAVLTRSVYWDVQGKHRPKPQALSAAEEQLRSTLGAAGVDWNQPISASAYQAWHDHHHVRADRIVRSGVHLLTLTTTVPDGDISEESLTVRDTDFHPIARKVGYRDKETVEIAELDFKILPWNSVDANVFEPIGGVETAGTPSMSRVFMLPAMPERLTDGQLDETELSARLVLNNLHADTGEQIEIARTERGVEVRGLVETNERKRDLQRQLAAVPHLTVSIQSVADLKNTPGISDRISSIKVASVVDMQSPLEAYLLARGHSVMAVNSLEQQLFDSALTISQESKAIDDLQSRFAASDQKTAIASATLAELIYSHHERMQEALKHERELVSEVQTGTTVGDVDSARKKPPLLDTAARNLVLCKELTLAGSPRAQSAEMILAEMSVVLNDLTADVREAYARSQGDSIAGENN
jgi:hypothetical protein